jgi:iron complex transport system ATP-binding protein
MQGITLNNISFAHDGTQPLFQNVTLEFERGRMYGIIGPNGSGKTTLIDLICGFCRPAQGAICLDGKALAIMSRGELSRRLALVAQNFRINFPYTVAELVMMGRYPYLGRLALPTPGDHLVVDEVLRQCDLWNCRHQRITELSGGEMQRTVVARALAQQCPWLLLDEATSNLDIHHTLAMLDLVRQRVKEGQSSVIAVFHDLNLAALYCDELVLMERGAVVKKGVVTDVLEAATLRKTFHVDFHIQRQPFNESLQVSFRRKDQQCLTP